MNAERILKIAVISMGVLIFALLGVVVWRIGTLAEDGEGAAGQPAPVASSGAAPAGSVDVSLDLAPGCRIAATTSDAGRLVIRTTGPSQACDAVYLFDLATGSRVGAINP